MHKALTFLIDSCNTTKKMFAIIFLLRDYNLPACYQDLVVIK